MSFSEVRIIVFTCVMYFDRLEIIREIEMYSKYLS